MLCAESERLKAQYESVMSQRDQELSALRTEREEVETGLRAHVAKAKQQEFVPQNDEKQVH